MPTVEELLELLQDDPDDYMLHYGLGMEYLRAERLSEAVESFEQAIRLQPDYSVAYRELARSLLRLNRPDRARPILVKGKEVAVAKSDLQVIKDIEKLLRELDQQLARG